MCEQLYTLISKSRKCSMFSTWRKLRNEENTYSKYTSRELKHHSMIWSYVEAEHFSPFHSLYKDDVRDKLIIDCIERLRYFNQFVGV